MAPEYGATCGFFPVDAETLNYLRTTGRPDALVRLVETYCREQGLFHTPQSPEPVFTEILSLDLATVEPSLAGPSRPQDRVRLGDVRSNFTNALPNLLVKAKPRKVAIPIDVPAAPVDAVGQVSPDEKVPVAAVAKEVSEGAPDVKPLQPPVGPSIQDIDGPTAEEVTERSAKKLRHGSVVIAAITSCTNTSNPSVMIAAGLLAKKAVARGLTTKPHVKTSLAPGSKVVTEYLTRAGLMAPLEELRFNLVGYGCTTCIGNSGPLPEVVSHEILEGQLVVAAVLSGNRNFEGRVHPEVRANYLASPPLVVAYAIAGRVDIDLTADPVGHDPKGEPVYLRDIWPTAEEVQQVIAANIDQSTFAGVYKDVFAGDEHWNALPKPTGDRYQWEPKSTYVKNPPYFEDMGMSLPALADLRGARRSPY